MRILFVGSNPSVKSKTNSPFCKSTKSGRILREWISMANISDKVFTINVCEHATELNKALSLKDIKVHAPMLRERINYILPNKVIALGKTAARALTLLGIEYYEMPHPSGLNRKLNDKSYVDKKIKGLKDYLSKPL